MKRKLLLLLIFALVFSGCNVPETLPTDTPTPEWTATPVPPTATATLTPTPTNTPLPAYLDVSPEDLSGLKLTLRCSLDGTARDRLEELVDLYNAENEDDITVELAGANSMDELADAVWGDTSSRTDLLIADSIWLRAQDAGNTFFTDLSDFMTDPVLSLEAEEIQPIMPVMQALEDQNGSFHALPLWTDPAMLFYNKTWALELGYEDSPTDLAAFAEQACGAGKANYADAEERKHGTGGWIVDSDPGSVMSWLLTFSTEGESVDDILREESGSTFQDAAAWLRNLFDNACAWNSRVREPYDYFANRYALFYSGTYSDARRQFNAFENSDKFSMDNWDLLFYPARSSDGDPRIYADTISAAIPKGDPKVMNAAWRFLRWLYSGTNAASLALAANGWPVQDSDEITRLYRNSGEDKLYQTLSYRQYIVNGEADENRITDQKILADGFAYVFNPSAKADDIPVVWEQIGSMIAEINAVSQNQNQTDLPDEPAPEFKETGVNDEEQL